MAKSNRPTERLSDLNKAPRIKKMRGQDKTWAEIADALSMTAGRAQFILLASQVKPADKIAFTTDDDLGKKIVKARDKDELSWPVIAARTGVTEGRVKDIYRRVKAGKPAAGERGKASSNGKGRKSTARAAVKSRKGRTTRKGKGRRRSARPSAS